MLKCWSFSGQLSDDLSRGIEEMAKYPKRLDSSELIKILQDLANKSGRVPTQDEFKAHLPGGRYKVGLAFKNSDGTPGKYSDLLEAAGFEELIGKVQDRTLSNPIIPTSEITSPPILDDDIPVEEIISSMVKRFDKRHEAHKAKKWMPFKVNSNLPIAIGFVGDPHLDDDGCNYPQLMKDVEIFKNTEGLYAINIGDTTNNWVGRLTKEYANQETSRSTAGKLVEWFLRDSGIKWMMWIMGNHDTWNFGSEWLSKVVYGKVTMNDWRAQFKLVFPNGRECLIDAAHNHTGHSQWNPLHGQQKASVMAGIAHIYIAGHLHNWALMQNECSHTHRVYWLGRARGYKHIDHYGENLGFGSQNYGSTVTFVIDPEATDANFVRGFADLQEAADYLTYLREKRSKKV